ALTLELVLADAGELEALAVVAEGDAAARQVLPERAVLQVILRYLRPVGAEGDHPPPRAIVRLEVPPGVEDARRPEARVDADQPAVAVPARLGLHVEVVREGELLGEAEVIR